MQRNTALHLAGLHGDIDTVEALSEIHPENVNIFNDSKKLPIYLAASMRSGVSDSEKLKCIRELLSKTDQEKLLTPTIEGEYLILSLVRFNNIEIISEVLNKNQKQLFLEDRRGQNLLHLSIIQGSPRLVDYFSDIEKLLQQKTQNGSTALHLACRYGDENIIRTIYNKILTLNLNQLINSKDQHGKTPRDYAKERNVAWILDEDKH